METENFRLGLRHLFERNVNDAAAVLRREPTESACYVEAQGNLALALVQQREFQEAEAVIRQIKHRLDDECRHIPSIVQFERTLGESLVGQGKADEAIQQFLNALKTANTLLKEHPDLVEKLSHQIVYVKSSLATAYLQLRRNTEDCVAALEQLLEARNLIDSYPDKYKVGYAQLYATLSEAYRLLDKKLESELAIKEGLQFAKWTNDDDQVARCLQTAIRLSSDILEPCEIAEHLEWIIDVAEEAENFKKAHLRCVIAAQIAEDCSEFELGLKFAQRAKDFEAKTKRVPFQFAALRTANARLLQCVGETGQAVTALLEGCCFWYEFIADKLSAEDFRANAARLHEDFRLASSLLFQESRQAEAFFVLEAGRSLHHACQVDESFLQRTISQNPFTADGQIKVQQFQMFQKGIPDNSCAVTLGIYPNCIVAFVVDANRIESTLINVPNEITNRIQALRYELERGTGEAAFPSELMKLAKGIAELANQRKICGFTPHSLLHEVPWRVLLRAAGMKWGQLAFAAGYSFLLRGDRNRRSSPSSVTAVAHGTSRDGSIDFSDEAEGFCNELNIQSKCIRNATAADTREALKTSEMVFISCHGRKASGDLLLKLSQNGTADSTETGIRDMIHNPIKAKLVILSACESGIYFVEQGDFPIGGIPTLLRSGVEYCIGTRFPIRATFARMFFSILAQNISRGFSIEGAFAISLEQVDNVADVDLWRDISCVELFGES